MNDDSFFFYVFNSVCVCVYAKDFACCILKSKIRNVTWSDGMGSVCRRTSTSISKCNVCRLRVLCLDFIMFAHTIYPSVPQLFGLYALREFGCVCVLLADCVPSKEVNILFFIILSVCIWFFFPFQRTVLCANRLPFYCNFKRICGWQLRRG